MFLVSLVVLMHVSYESDVLYVYVFVILVMGMGIQE